MKKSPKHKIAKKHTTRTTRRSKFFSLAPHHQIIIVFSLSIAFFLGISFFANQQAFPSHAANQVTYKCDFTNKSGSSTPNKTNGYTYYVPSQNKYGHGYCKSTEYCNSNHNGTITLNDTKNTSGICEPIGQPGHISKCKCDNPGSLGGSFTCNNGNVKRSCGSNLVCDNPDPKNLQSGLWPCELPPAICGNGKCEPFAPTTCYGDNYPNKNLAESCIKGGETISNCPQDCQTCAGSCGTLGTIGKQNPGLQCSKSTLNGTYSPKGYCPNSNYPLCCISH